MIHQLWTRLQRYWRRQPNEGKGLTREQRVALRRYDAEVSARPDAVAPRLNRARFLERNGGEFESIVADLRAALRLRPDPQKWRNSRQLLEECRENWAHLQSNLRIVDVRFWRARLVASFDVALELEDDTALWRTERDDSWDALAVLERAANAESPLPASENVAPAELKMWALAVAITRYSRHWEQAAAVNEQAASLYARAWREDAEGALALAREAGNADYQQLAGWNLVVEAAPGEVRWWVSRAGWRKKRHDYGGSRADFTRAIALAPDDATLYEKRADVSRQAHWWDLTPDSLGAAADDARALRLRIKSGEYGGTSAQLAKQGAQLKARLKGRHRARAYAYYAVAIELEPDKARYYLGRAQTLDMPPLRGRGAIEAQLEAAHRDYLHALARDETLHEAREAIIQYLSQTLARPTAHEQLEALLQARDLMIEMGVDANLASEIIVEVGRVLAG